MKGTILHSSWGYDMTINDYAVVIDDTPKSVLCKMLGTKVTDDAGMGNGRSTPDINKAGDKTFRLFKRGTPDNPYFKGSYPFCNDSAKRMGLFRVWDGRSNYYNTWD